MCAMRAHACASVQTHPAPTAYVRGQSLTPEIVLYKNILVATDGSALSLKAVAHAMALAQALGAKLTAFHASAEYPMPAYDGATFYEAIPPGDYAKLCKKESDRILGAIARKAASSRVEFAAVQAIASTPWEAILAAARKQKCDVIVMASHGRRGVSALLLGSETQKVLTYSKLPVLVLR